MKNSILMLVVMMGLFVSKCYSQDVDSSVSDTASVSVTPGEAIDLGLSVKWASCNVGANSPEEYGGYYSWGETEPKSVYSATTYKYYKPSNKSYIYLGNTISGTKYDVAHVKWGGSWRMPTLKEMKELLQKCKSENTTYKDVQGFKFTGPNGNSIFLPAAGWYFISDYGVGWLGSYWTATLDSDFSFFACYLSFDYHYNSKSDNPISMGRNDRLNGCSVRPVSD